MNEVDPADQTQPIDTAVARYANKLTAMQQADPAPSVEQVLGVLVARDGVQAALTDRTQDMEDALLKLEILDQQLRQSAERVYSTVDVRNWHQIIHPDHHAWWWFLEQPPRTHWTVRFDWVWNLATVIWLMAAIALIVDVTRRFLSIGPDTLETFIVLGEGSIALLAAGGALTLAGRKLTDQFLLRLHVPVRFLQETKAILAILLLVGLIWLRVSLPELARLYNNRGVQRFQQGQLTYALRDYGRALSLDPNYVQAHYNLGLLYEDIGDFETAAIQYRFATQGDLDLAYINLARLYIMDESFSQAASLLELRLLKAEEADVRYDMLKNLGWARLGQERYEEAASRLNQAIALRSGLAPGHCLLAQALEGMDEFEEALSEWELCLAYASVFRPDEDEWINMAQQRFAAE